MTRRWALVALVFLGILISYVDRGNLSIAAAAMMRDFAMRPESMGVLLSAFFWTYAICQIPAGLLVDRFGIRFVYAGAFLLWSLASASVALSRSPHDVVALRMLLGLAESVGPLASLAFIRQNFRSDEQGLPTAIYIAGQTIGPACGALLGSALLAHFGWRALFAATGLGALLWAPVWAWFAPKRTASISGQRPQSRVDWNSVAASPAFFAMSACVLFFSYYWYFLLTWMPSYLILERGFSTTAMGRIFSVPLFAMAAITLPAGAWADRLVKRSGQVLPVRLRFAGAGLLGASSILLLNAFPNRGLVLPILVFSICSFGLVSSNYWAIAQYTSPSRLVGRATGYLNTLSQIGGVVAPLVTGWSLGQSKNFRLAILIAGLCPLISFALLFAAGPRRLSSLKQTLTLEEERA